MARTWTIGVLVPSVTNPMYADVIAGAEGRAQELGYGVVFRTHVEGEREEIFTRLLQPRSRRRADRGQRAAARRLHPPHRRREEARWSSSTGGSTGSRPAWWSTMPPARRWRPATCSTTATSTLVGLFGPPAIDTSRRRRNGYSRALRSAGLETVAVDMPGWDFRNGYDGIHQIFDGLPGHDSRVRVDDGDGRRGDPRAARARARPSPTTSRSSPCTTASSPATSTRRSPRCRCRYARWGARPSTCSPS